MRITARQNLGYLLLTVVLAGGADCNGNGGGDGPVDEPAAEFVDPTGLWSVQLTPQSTTCGGQSGYSRTYYFELGGGLVLFVEQLPGDCAVFQCSYESNSAAFGFKGSSALSTRFSWEIVFLSENSLSGTYTEDSPSGCVKVWEIDGSRCPGCSYVCSDYYSQVNQDCG